MPGPGKFDEETLRSEALVNFPYEIRKVPGRDAFKEWERLRAQEGVYPVVIGGDEELKMLLEPFHPLYYASGMNARSVNSILKAAEGLSHPESLHSYIEAQNAAATEAVRSLQKENVDQNESILAADDKSTTSYDDVAKLNEQLVKSFSEKFGIEVSVSSADDFMKETVEREEFEPEVGRWPLVPPNPTGLIVAHDLLTGKHLSSVNIVLIPTDDGTEAPAYLRWGGWNDNPPPEYHVAALRSWRDRYGAELVGLSHDVMNIRVEKKPKTKDEALALAREHYYYCYDIVEQGTGELAPLAASLKAHIWWYFWWD